MIECKNANKDEAIALGVDQIRRYHREMPELFVPQQLFTATDAIGFSYGVTWNTVRRNIFNWKDEEGGKLETKVKSFCAIPQVLAFLKDYIVFAEKDEELNKYIRGWCDENGQPTEEQIQVSYDQLVRDAGISKGSLRKAIDEALGMNFIKRIEISSRLQDIKDGTVEGINCEQVEAQMTTKLSWLQ